MSGEDLKPASDWELPAGILMAGTVLLAAGISNNTWGVCCIGLFMIIVAIFWLIRIWMRKLDPNIREEDHTNDLEEMDRHKHTCNFHGVQ